VKVLIADDNSVSSCCWRGCEPLGYEVIQAPMAPRLANTPAGRSAEASNLDWMMPGMSGPEVCAEARKRVASAYA